MYCNFFGFSEKPFDVTPDPRFLYLSPGHRETLAALIYGIQERRGFITIVGEVGIGKTTLLNTALGQLDEKTPVAFIYNTNATFDEILTMTLVDLALAKPEESVPKVEALCRLNDFAIRQLASGGNVVLLVDEAQNLNCAALENLRLLSNLETRKHKLIQIVLSGQRELDVKLRQPELQQLAQRISLRRYITPLNEQETDEYIQHRLSKAKCDDPTVFSRQARRLIWGYSGGVPRKINVLCDNALLIGYALRQKTIKASVIEEAIRDLRWSPFSDCRENHVAISVQPVPRGKEKSSQFRFDTASLILIALFYFLFGLLFATSWFNLQGSELIPIWTSIRSNIPIALARPEQAPVQGDQPASHEQSTIEEKNALSTLLQERSGSGHGMDREAPYGQRASSGGTAGRENQEPTANLEPSPRRRGESLPRGARAVVVKRGDNLFRIIVRAYGKYDRATLRAVLGENPKIQSAEQIKAGQVIRLPEKK